MFNHLYDVPRSAPLPISAERHSATPAVPEISMIFGPPQRQNFHPRTEQPQRFPPNTFRCDDKENFCIRANRDKRMNLAASTNGTQVMKPVKANFLPNKVLPKFGANFNDIYLANVPNRHLDLSMIDLPKKTGGTQEVTFRNLPKPMEENLKRNNTENLREDCQILKDKHNLIYENDDMFNYKPTCKNSVEDNKSDSFEAFHMKTNLPANTTYRTINRTQDLKDEDKKICLKTDDEPTIKDLLKIIQQQNEQLLILQKQVSHLIEHQTQPIEPAPNFHRQKELFGEKREQRFLPHELRKGPMSKLSIDVTTSFEVSVVRRQQNCRAPEPKIREITEDDVLVFEGRRGSEESLVLDEPLSVREECQSPVNSIHVDMNDYSSDSGDETDNANWTLYNNIMEQVNHILSNAQKGTNGTKKSEGTEKMYRHETMKKVREATMGHLKSLGVNISDDSLKSADDNRKYTSSEISFAVKQLLMKYLPPEQLAKVVSTKKNEARLNNDKELVDLIRKKPEFSLATLQYMRKYNLLTSDEAPPNTGTNKNVTGKILDITALKQQPKLL